MKTVNISKQLLTWLIIVLVVIVTTSCSKQVNDSTPEEVTVRVKAVNEGVEMWSMYTHIR